MPVSVRLPTIMRAHAGGNTQVVAEGSTLGEIVDDLIRQFPGIEPNLKSPEGGIHKFVNVYINDEDVRFLDRLDTKVTEDDKIVILPAVAGGAV